MDGTAPSMVDGRAAMQDWKFFPMFLQERHCQVLQSDEFRQLKKIETVSRYLVDLGLRHPSERTMTTLASLVSHVSGQHNDEDAARLQALLATVKSVLKTHVTRAKQVAMPLFSNYLAVLPATVLELPEPMRSRFFPTGAFAPPVDVNPIFASAAIWPCRSTNRQVALTRQLTAAGNPVTDGMNRLTMVAHQAALQTAAALVALNGGAAMPVEGGGGGFLPGLEILPAGREAMARAQQTNRASPLAALMDRAEAPRREQVVGPGATGATTETRGVLQATVSRSCEAVATVAVPQPDVPSEGLATSVQPEVDGSAVDADMAELDRGVRNLAAKHYGASLEALPEAEPKELETCKTRPARKAKSAAKRGRPAASSSIVQQASKCATSVAKSTAALKKPASAKSVLKKPAASPKTGAKSPVDGRVLQVLTKQQSLRKRPVGCSRCRHTPGCCPSCWTLRGYRVLA